jgi:hypothetical protein
MHPAHGWGSPTPPTPARSGVRIPRPLIIGLALLCVGLLAGLTRSPRGLLVIAAAWLLVALFDTRRAAGRWLRVAALVALLLAAAPAPTPTRPAVRRPPAASTEATQVSLEDVRGQVADLWQQVASGFSRATTPPPKGGR